MTNVPDLSYNVTGNVTGHIRQISHLRPKAQPPVKRSRATIRDVAKRAGVSHQTVSRVINGDPLVTPETRARVDAAIAELGYQPNAIDRSLATGCTHALACLAPDLTDFTFARISEGAEAGCRQHGFPLTSSSAPGEASFVALINGLVSSRLIDGLMWSGWTTCRWPRIAIRR